MSDRNASRVLTAASFGGKTRAAIGRQYFSPFHRGEVWSAFGARMSMGFIFLKKGVPGVEQCPEQRIERENAGEQIEYEVPVARRAEQGADHGREQGGADVAASVHDREDRGDALTAE